MHVSHSSFYFPSLTSSFTPAQYMFYMYMYVSPSPLCVLLTLCCDDVHSAGGVGKMLLGRGLGHDCTGWDTTARAGTRLRGLGHDWGTRVQSPGGYLGETGILLLACLATILWFYQLLITLFPQCSFSCFPSLPFYYSLIILFSYSFLLSLFHSLLFSVLHSPYVLLLSECVYCMQLVCGTPHYDNRTWSAVQITNLLALWQTVPAPIGGMH